MSSLKKVFKNTRVVILIVFIILALIAINPKPWATGVAIRGVGTNSSASLAGMEGPTGSTPPVLRDVIVSMNGQPIHDISDYYKFVSTLQPNVTVMVKTRDSDVPYALRTKPIINTTILEEMEEIEIVEEVFDNETNSTVNITSIVERPKMVHEVVGTEGLGLSVYNAPTSNLRLGLDLSGGTRVVLSPERELAEENMTLIIDNIKQRLNVFGLSDIVVRSAEDAAVGGQQYIIIEIAGATSEEVRELLSQQGKFEAKIGDDVVFVGGRKDITYVCRTAQCSGIDTQAGSSRLSDGSYVYRFQFAITLSPEAAQRQADITDTLSIISLNGQQTLSKPLDLYLDDTMVTNLTIAPSLKGRAETEIAISGTGFGRTSQEGINDALQNMRNLQTILITGSLPVKLEVVKIDAISPVLGEEFISNAIWVAICAVIGVVLTVFLRYRVWQIMLPMTFTLFAEAFVVLGIASMISWNLDLASIAGIIIALGTGVDDQIVITDETLRKRNQKNLTWKERLKRAFFIIMAAYFTTIVAMAPLWFAGAGLLRGFALTTIIGVSVGVFISRPAYAAMVELLMKNKE